MWKLLKTFGKKPAFTFITFLPRRHSCSGTCAAAGGGEKGVWPCFGVVDISYSSSCWECFGPLTIGRVKLGCIGNETSSVEVVTSFIFVWMIAVRRSPAIPSSGVKGGDESSEWIQNWAQLSLCSSSALARLLPGYIHTIYPLSILSTTRTCTIPRQLPRWWSLRRKSVKSTLTFSAFNAFVFIYLYSWCAASITWDDDSWALIVKPHHSCLWTICNRASREPSRSLKLLYNHREHLRHF